MLRVVALFATSVGMMKHSFLALAALIALSACDMLGHGELDTPQRMEDERQFSRGRLSGDGFDLLGGGDGKTDQGAVLGVNSYLWRATLDTISFMPFQSADPFGGVIITDWYEDPKAAGERFKINALIMDTGLRADGVKVTLFKQRKEADGWRDIETNPELARQIEDTILTRARELRVTNLSR